MKANRLLVLFLGVFFSELLVGLMLVFALRAELLILLTDYDLVNLIIFALAGLVTLAIIAVLVAGILNRLLFKEEAELHYFLENVMNKNNQAKFGLANNQYYLNPTNSQLLADINRYIKELERSKQQLSLANDQVSGFRQDHIVKEERQRIARELHDSVSQQLFAMTMVLSALASQNLPNDSQALLEKVIEMVHAAQAEMRALLLHLRPVSLTNASLKTGIEKLFAELDTKVAMRLETRLQEVDIAHDIEDNLFRMIQELLSNSLRHAQANIIECELYDEYDEVIVRFIDDGKGFDYESDYQSQSGYGLKNIKERVDQLSGQLNVMSQIGKGTVVEIRIPK